MLKDAYFITFFYLRLPVNKYVRDEMVYYPVTNSNVYFLSLSDYESVYESVSKQISTVAFRSLRTNVLCREVYQLTGCLSTTNV